MGRCEGVVRRCVGALCVVCVWSVVSAQSAEEERCNVCPADCVGRRYARYWWTSMWGFVVTLVVLTMDAWGITKPNNLSKVQNVVSALLGSGLNPLYMVMGIREDAIIGMAMLGNLREELGNKMVAPRFPWSKSNVKIIVGTDVVVNISENVYERVCKSLNAFDNEVNVKDFSEAIVIGERVGKSSKYNVELRAKGKLALLRADVLPEYDQLKVLRGTSTLGMVAAAAQAVGYIYAIVVRRVQSLRVSPIEAIGSFLNIVVLMKVVLHNFASVSHKPLLLYLTPNDEAKFIEECKKVTSFQFKRPVKSSISFCIAIGSLWAVIIYFIIIFKQTLNVQCIVPVVLFQVSLVLGHIFFYLRQYMVSLLGMPLVVLMNTVGYVLAIVVSFKYWKEYEFDVQTSNYLSQVLPYIG